MALKKHIYRDKKPIFETLTCCVVLVVVDELRDGAEIVLLSQVKVSLGSGADVIVSAASTRFSVESVERE